MNSLCKRLAWTLITCLILSSFSFLLADETFGVPVPVVALDPNKGSTLGILLAVVSEDAGRLNTIMAPVLTHNELEGISFDFNLFGFPTEDIDYKLYLSIGTEEFWGGRIYYEHKRFMHNSLKLTIRISVEKTSSDRFYGIGRDTEEDDESNYTPIVGEGYVKLTAEVFRDVYLSFSIGANRYKIKSGTVEDVDSTDEKFPNVEGVEDGSYSLPFEMALEYNSVDCDVSPTSGLHGRIFIRVADESLLSSFSYRRYGAMARFFFAVDKEKRFITAVRGLVEYMEGDDIPFYELNSLGGESLRGFGVGRFYDKHRILANIEERIRLFRWLAGDILLDIETVVFLDVGQVTHSLRDIDFKDMEFVVGTGIRMVVRSQIVAKVDIGFGSEGSKIYASLDYPF